MAYVGFFIAVVVALIYFFHIEYERDNAGKIVFRRMNPSVALKAAAALTPLYLAYFPAGISEDSRNFLNATALTVIAVPLALPFWTIPKQFESRFGTFFPAWLTITAIRIGLAYLLDWIIEFFAEHVGFLNKIFIFIADGSFNIAHILPDGPFPDMPLSIKTLLVFGLFMKILRIAASPGNFRRALLFSLSAPWILTYVRQVFEATRFPEHHIEFAIVPGFLFGLAFLFFTEYQIILQARSLQNGTPE